MLQIKDNKRDDILNLIIKNTTQALSFKLGLKDSVPIPDVLDYIALEVSVKRYNRLANEGMSSYTKRDKALHLAQMISMNLQTILMLGKMKMA